MNLGNKKVWGGTIEITGEKGEGRTAGQLREQVKRGGEDSRTIERTGEKREGRTAGQLREQVKRGRVGQQDN